MGCDIDMFPERPPYCSPRCEEFRLVVALDKVRAACVKCGLHQEVTVVGDRIKVHYEEPARLLSEGE